MTPTTSTPSLSKSALLSAISSIGRPMPPGETSSAFAPSSFATRALDNSKTLPTPAWPVPSISVKSFSHDTRSKARQIRSVSSASIGPGAVRNRRVKVPSTATGLMLSIGTCTSKSVSSSTESSSIFCPRTSTKRWPMGLMNPTLGYMARIAA